MKIFSHREKIFLNICRRQTYHCAKRNITPKAISLVRRTNITATKIYQIFVATSHAPQITERRFPTLFASPIT